MNIVANIPYSLVKIYTVKDYSEKSSPLALINS